jgi:hypothetical protein
MLLNCPVQKCWNTLVTLPASRKSPSHRHALLIATGLFSSFVSPAYERKSLESTSKRGQERARAGNEEAIVVVVEVVVVNMISAVLPSHIKYSCKPHQKVEAKANAWRCTDRDSSTSFQGKTCLHLYALAKMLAIQICHGLSVYLYTQDEEKLRLAIKDVRHDSTTTDFCLALLDSSTMELGYHSSGAGYVLNMK